MSIFLKRYHNMVITPQDDRILFDSIFDDYGLIYGGSAVMSASNKIHVGSARGFIKGSEVIIEDDDIAVELSDNGSKPGRLKIVVDYSDSSNPVKFESEVADSFPALEQDDNINHTNGRYEVVYATYTAAETVISNVRLVMPTMQSVKEKLVTLNTDISERINGVVVWQSPDISQKFEGQTVQLTTDIYDYHYWEVVYFYAATSRYVLTTGKLPIGRRDAIMHVSTGAIFTRNAVLHVDSLLFSMCSERGEFYTDGIINNNYIIPYLVKLYK